LSAAKTEKAQTWEKEPEGSEATSGITSAAVAENVRFIGVHVEDLDINIGICGNGTTSFVGATVIGYANGEVVISGKTTVWGVGDLSKLINRSAAILGRLGDFEDMYVFFVRIIRKNDGRARLVFLHLDIICSRCRGLITDWARNVPSGLIFNPFYDGIWSYPDSTVFTGSRPRYTGIGSRGYSSHVVALICQEVQRTTRVAETCVDSIPAGRNFAAWTDRIVTSSINPVDIVSAAVGIAYGGVAFH
jgi:hypothetical protein